MAGGLRASEKGFEEPYVCVCVISDRGKTVECKSWDQKAKLASPEL